MASLEIRPLVGVGAALFGSPRCQIRMLFGDDFRSFQKTSASISQTDLHVGGALHAFYDSNDQLDYIEIVIRLSPPLLLCGQRLDVSSASRLSAQLAGLTKCPSDVRDKDCTHVFVAAAISLWRSSGDRPSFDALGVGRPGYFG